MLKGIGIGIDDFKEIIDENAYFVDKSLFIKDFMEDKSKIIIIPRPRRFGKSLNLSMLKYFLDNKEDSKHLFEGLEISEHKEFCKEHLNKHPVIFIGLKELKFDTWEETYIELRDLIRAEFERHSNIKESLEGTDLEIFNDLLSWEPKVENLRKSLFLLSKYLEKHYGKKAILLMDEYDAPIHKSYIEDYYKKAMNFFQQFFGSAMKSNVYLKKGLMTGILRVSKESMFSGLNNVEVSSILSNHYSQYFGFTEEEAIIFAKTYDIDTEGMKDWYNGYRIGDSKMYNSWSIINYVKNRGDLKAYWVNTSSNDLIRKLMKEGIETTKNNIVSLVEGNNILKEVNENISLKNIDLEKETNFLSLLLFSGYLTWTEKVKNGDITKYKLAIPNKEVKSLLKSMLKEISKSINDLNKMLSNIKNQEWDKFKENFEKSVAIYFSYFDTNGVSENFYHAFVMGMLVNLEREYNLRSNREAGFGRYDVSIVKKDRTFGVIFEFKKVLFNEEIEEIAKKALKQIEEREYEKEFDGVKMKKIGIAFKGKRALVLFDN